MTSREEHPDAAADWRTELLEGVSLQAADAGGAGAPAAVRWGVGRVGAYDAVLVVWDFAVAGGSFGERDASSLGEAVDAAVRAALPVVALVRSGGTRLPEGVRALAGMARATLARERLAAAHLPLLAVADQPTTGGVLVAVVSRADLRVGVAGAVVGFAGPRVVEAVTGHPPGSDSHTADSAHAAGTLDAVLPAPAVSRWLEQALAALARWPPPSESSDSPESPAPRDPPGASAPPDPDRGPWEQVLATRERRPGAAALLRALLARPVALQAPHGDASVAACVGRCPTGGVVGVALAAGQGARVTGDGFRLLTRAARLADRLDLPLLTLVDTPGAEPGPAAERDLLPSAVADAMAAVLACRAPTVGVLVGEGGSGGALAALVCDRVLASPQSYFAALVPEGAAVALRTTPREAAVRLRLTPRDVLATGVVDALTPDPAADPAGLRAMVVDAMASLAAGPTEPRLARRQARWSGPAPGG